ncbi:hypothetical protein ACVIW2_008840 [Bradyrhizobium huanghuaihaiense]|uniref:Uncharacterized protein n=1 Tax=Bradyrhizobium huanghuaihaiense TaxID=990078 RepID=A0A562RAC5_9BRAD|nr:hypothetical protein IQ16_05120 [Bradyrhizobium huanghuaihaiense]
MARAAYVVFFAVAGIIVCRYLLRGIDSGKLWAGIRGGNETWLVRQDDPASFWIVVCLIAVADIGLGIMAVQSALVN